MLRFLLPVSPCHYSLVIFKCSMVLRATPSTSEPFLSDLLITNISPISINPAFIVCTASPDSGTSTTIVVSAVCAISSSDCPTPTVSIIINSLPLASSISHASLAFFESPPRLPLVAIERMKVSLSLPESCILILSPSNAPPVNGLVGSTAIIPTLYPFSLSNFASPLVIVLLPAPRWSGYADHVCSAGILVKQFK